MERPVKRLKSVSSAATLNLQNLPKDIIIKILVDSHDIEDVYAFCHTNQEYKHLCQSKEFLYSWFRVHEPLRFSKLKSLQPFEVGNELQDEMNRAFKKAFKIARIRRWSREFPAEFDPKISKLLTVLERDTPDAIDQMYSKLKRSLPPESLNKRHGAGKKRRTNVFSKKTSRKRRSRKASRKKQSRKASRKRQSRKRQSRNTKMFLKYLLIEMSRKRQSSRK